MKINLIPVSHQTLTTIEIATDEFIIGRSEEPFISSPNEMTHYMSRRHAKIFREHDHYCIVDLGSQNGTKLNSMVVNKQPFILNQNDEIEIAEHLKFKVEIIDPQLDATRLIQKSNEELTLEPVDKQSGLDILVITGFPFLISKEVGVFSSYQTEHAAEIAQLSRRHAHITFAQGAFKITDMGSTNGTFINNDRIDTQGRILQNGDILTFGGHFFSYSVKLDPSQQQQNNDATIVNPVTEPERTNNETQESVENEEIDDDAARHEVYFEPKTTFVNDPSPFLDILCAGDEIDANNDANSVDFEKTHYREQKSSVKKRSFFGKIPIKNKWVAVGLTSIFLVIIGSAIFYYFYGRSADIEELIAQGQFSEAADQSIPLLVKAPENSGLLKLSTRAILNSLVPQWQNALKNREFQTAEALREQMQMKYAANPDIEKAIPLMHWVNQLFQFMAMRNETTKVVLFQNEQQLKRLLEEWHRNKLQNELILAQIERNVPAFKETYNEVLSDLRTLEHDQDVYIKAIDILKARLLKKIQSDQTDELMVEATKFEQKYPAIAGVDNLKLDISRYIEFNDALKAKDIHLIHSLRKQMVFLTPLFKTVAEQDLVGQFPSTAFNDQYIEAVRSWQAGEIENSINTLLALVDDKWGAAASIKLQRYQRVLDQYNTLASSRNTPEYVDNLFTFHAQLQLPEDDYFLKAIETDFLENKELAITTVEEHVDSAQKNWQKYKRNGGIDGLLRLESQVSRKYRQQAALLAQAYQDISYANRLYTELKIMDNKLWNQSHAAIVKEMDKQNKWLQDLELILSPSVLKQKLNLLNTPEEL